MKVDQMASENIGDTRPVGYIVVNKGLYCICSWPGRLNPYLKSLARDSITIQMAIRSEIVKRKVLSYKMFGASFYR